MLYLLNISNLCNIFRLRVRLMLGGPFFESLENNFTVKRRPEVWSNFPQICIKIIENMKINWENFRKMQISSENFHFLPYAWGKISISIYPEAIVEGLAGEGAKLEKMSRILSKYAIAKCKKLWQICRRLFAKLFKNMRKLQHFIKVWGWWRIPKRGNILNFL